MKGQLAFALVCIHIHLNYMARSLSSMQPLVCIAHNLFLFLFIIYLCPHFFIIIYSYLLHEKFAPADDEQSSVNEE